MTTETTYSREKVLWMAVIPQAVLLAISILWIFLMPKYNVSVYLKINWQPIVGGLITGVGLAMSGYGFYNFTKKTKKFYETVELFEQVLAPAFKNLKLPDIIVLSIVSGFCEEIFFRGLMQPVFGIVLASIAFGLLHLPGFKYWIYALWASLSGALFGFLFIMTSSLWFPITAHAVNNTIGMVLLTRLEKNKKSS